MSWGIGRHHRRAKRCHNALAAALALAFTGALAAAAPASAAVPREGNTFSPRNGAELLEAADFAAADVDAGLGKYTIELAAESEYRVGRPVQLPASTRLRTLGVWDEAPTLTNDGAPGPLLQLDGGTVTWLPALRPDHEGWSATAPTQLNVELTGATSAAFPLVEIIKGSADGLEVTVATSTPNVTGVALDPAASATGGASASLIGSEVYSGAKVPAVLVGARGVLSTSLVDGGNPTVRALSSSDSGARIRQSYLLGDSSSDEVIDIAAEAVPVTVASSIIDGWFGSPTLIRVGGTAPSTVRHLLRQLTLDGDAESTAVRVEAGSVDAPGLLSIGSQTLLSCAHAGGGSLPDVWLDGFFADGEPGPTAGGCALHASGRKTGDHRLADADLGIYEPRWGSPLIDAAPSARSGRFDLMTGLLGGDLFGAEFQQVIGPETIDIGAIEYVRAAPTIKGVTFGVPDAAGNVEVTPSVIDPNHGEVAELTYRWAYNGQLHETTGLTATLPTVAGTAAPFTVTATDPSGATSLVWSGVLPAGPRLPPQLPPRQPDRPRSPVVLPPTVAPAPTVVEAKLLRGRIKASTSKRKLRIGKPARGEGAIEITANRPGKLFISAWREVTSGKGKKRRKKLVAVKGARGSVALRAAHTAGPVQVALPARLGKVRLKPGRYELRIKRGSATGPSVGKLKVRVTR